MATVHTLSLSLPLSLPLSLSLSSCTGIHSVLRTVSMPQCSNVVHAHAVCTFQIQIDIELDLTDQNDLLVPHKYSMHVLPNNLGAAAFSEDAEGARAALGVFLPTVCLVVACFG